MKRAGWERAGDPLTPGSSRLAPHPRERGTGSAGTREQATEPGGSREGFGEKASDGRAAAAVRWRSCGTADRLLRSETKDPAETTASEPEAMPNSPSANKALRKALKRRELNRPQRSALRTAIKKVRKAVDAKDEAGAKDAFRVAVKKLDQAADKNLIHKNTAARTKSRLSALLKRTFRPEKAAQAAG